VIELSTYVFETLREDGEYVLYRGRRRGDGSRLLAMAPVSEDPSVRSLERLEHEYSFREELEPDWAAQPIALERRDGRTVILLADPGGIPLASLLGRPMELMLFLRLELDEFLEQVMVAITRQLGSVSSALRCRNHQLNCLTLPFVFQDGRVMTPAVAKYPEDLQSVPLDEWQLRTLNKSASVMDLVDNPAGIPDVHRDYLVGLGVKTFTSSSEAIRTALANHTTSLSPMLF
jgi:hypothetical protein